MRTLKSRSPFVMLALAVAALASQGAIHQANAQSKKVCRLPVTVTSQMISPGPWPVRVMMAPTSPGQGERQTFDTRFGQTFSPPFAEGTVFVAGRSQGHKLAFLRIEHRCGGAFQPQILHLSLRTTPTKQAMIRLPFADAPERVRYRVERGRVIAFGDIDLGEEKALLARQASNPAAGYYRGSNPNPPRKAPLLTVPGARSFDGTVTVRQPLTWVTDNDLLWPAGVVPYAFDPDAGFTASQKRVIEAQMAIVERDSNVRFVDKQPYHEDYVMITEGKDAKACGSSKIGRVGGKQFLRLRKGCLGAGDRTTIHELLHALGIYHEQSRPDRDDFVRILWDNIDGGKDGDYAHNFAKVENVRSTDAYDTRSIMHYSRNAFGARALFVGPRATTIECLNNCNGDDFGSTVLSPLDRIGLLRMYPGISNHYDGFSWAAGVATTDIEFANITGDGKVKMIVARDEKRTGQSRVLILDPMNNYEPLTVDWEDERGWGPNSYPVAVAAGNIDDDAAEEYAVARISSVGTRVNVYDYDPEQEAFLRVATVGTQWGRTSHARDIEFGDIDGDGRDELVIVTNSRNANPGQVIFRNGPAALQVWQFPKDGQPPVLSFNGAGSFPGQSATRVDTGDVDFDGRAEILITTNGRKKGQERFVVLKYPGSPTSGWPRALQKSLSGGEDWDDGTFATDAVVGRTMADSSSRTITPAIAIARVSNTGPRAYLYEAGPDCLLLCETERFGSDWPADHYAYRLTFANLDQDWDHELIIGRGVGRFVNSSVRRLEGYDFSDGEARPILFSADPYPLAGNQRVTALAAGDIDNDGGHEIGIGNGPNRVFILSGGGGFGGGDPRPSHATKRFGLLN